LEVILSGHSKWAQIKHKKAAEDKKKGATFSKLVAAIAVAAREGGSDPAANFKLRLAIDQARQANMPNENIDRAIKKGTGDAGSVAIEEVTFEGFGPAGVSIIAEGVTDNKNRTLSEIKHIFTEYGGRLGSQGAVAYQFEPKGIISLKKPDHQDELELELIDAGAEDFEEAENSLIIYTSPAGFGKVKKILVDKGIEITSAELAKEAKITVPINNTETAERVLKLVETLEAHDDILAVYANFDIPDEILKEIK
jgi:YebC/PmpR family DNA-binding regulatory protein